MTFSSSWFSSTNSLSLELKPSTDHNDPGRQPKSEETNAIQISKGGKWNWKSERKLLVTMTAEGKLQLSLQLKNF